MQQHFEKLKLQHVCVSVSASERECSASERECSASVSVFLFFVVGIDKSGQVQV